MNYEAERAMNQKRLRMEAEPGHGVVQGNGLPLNYIDNGHQIPYQPYAGAYNTHYPPPDAFAAYGPPPPGGYAPQNLSYAPPAHQNYPHHQSFPPQQPQAQLHMAQTHMVQGYGDVHKAAAAAAAAAWGPQPHLLPPALDAKPPLPEHKPKEIKLEPPDAQKRPHAEADLMSGELEQPKIKIKTDIFKPDELAPRPEPAVAPPRDIPVKPLECAQKPVELQKDDGLPISADGKPVDKPSEASKPDAAVGGDALSAKEPSANADKSLENAKGFSSPESKAGSSPGKSTPGSEQKKRGRPKGSTNKPKPPGTKPPAALGPRGPPPPRPAAPPRPRAMGYQYAMRPFRKDFSGIQFRRRWSDDCLDSTHIPNEVYFGDVPVTAEVLHNYYDANAERERLAAHAAHLAAQKAAAAKLAQAKLQARGITQEVTTVDSSSSEDSSGSDEESEDSDEDAPLKKAPATPKPKPAKKPATPGKRGRPPVPPELRQPGITDMKKFCKAAGIRFDYKKLVEGCTKNKERVAKMMELLTAAGLAEKPSLEACRALKAAKAAKKDQEKQAKKDAKAKHKEDARTPVSGDAPRRMTRGATGVKPRQRIVISSDEEDGTPLARRTLSKLRSSVRDDSDSD